MSEIESWQPDLHQRYELLRRLLHTAFSSHDERPVTVIDVGSGPERLTENALGSGFTVTRTDVGEFDDAEIVRLHPGSPLPFEDDSADVVIAMDVLEHVPALLRSSLLDECSRVARHLVVIACPTDDGDVRAAEDELAAMAVTVSGQPLTFLEEHAAYGLPLASTTLDGLERTCATVAVVGNAPLALWAPTNSIDFILNFRVSDPEVKRRVNRSMNVAPVVCGTGEPSYRTFFLGSPNQSIDVNALANGLLVEQHVPSVMSILVGATELLSVELERALGEATHLKARLAALELERASMRAAARGKERSDDQLVRTVRALEEQLATVRHDLIVTQAGFDHLTALASIPTPTPSTPTFTRRAAAKARRSPRWAARKARGAARRVMGRRATPAPVAEPLSQTTPTRFDQHWYLLRNPDVRDAGVDPWTHYLDHGRFEGRSPHPLFDRAWYCEQYPDSAVDGADPFADWATDGMSMRRNPNEFFDTDWYLGHHPEVAEAGLDPVEHYRLHGWREGRRPGPLFDPTWYLGTYPDVALADTDPLTHFVQFGRGEGRHANHLEHVAAAGWYRPADGLIPWFSPVNFRVTPELTDDPCLNILIPGMGVRHLTGGPNTALQFGYRLASRGQRVRFIATDAALDDDVEPLWAHMAAISDSDARLSNVEVVDGSNRFRPVHIGENDLFMATAWWTAQSIKAALPLMQHQQFLYLIQDFEPLFFASSSQYALALETYELDHIPVVNSQFLLDHLAHEQVGRFADPSFVDSAIVFEPTVDRSLFRPTVPTSAKAKRRLLFYARPQNGLRNLFELGVAAMQMAIQQGVLDESEWEFCGMGDPFDPIAVGPRTILNPVPWKDFNSYAAQMRESDILLSLMLAPHPSYPPLEMAACGGIAVTTEFGPKTSARLAEISTNLIGTPATIEGIAQGLADAVERLDDVRSRLTGSDLALPATWHDVFATVLPEVEARLRQIVSATDASSASAARLMDRYGRWRSRRITERVDEFPIPELPDDVTFSLMTPVWNTPAPFLRELADSVAAQDLTHSWEWVITDNGSTDAGTLAVLEELKDDDRVRFVRQESNLGILGGMHSCLVHASGRYVLHLDHDDLLTPDALRVAAAVLADAGWPEAFYSDEDKVRGSQFAEPYLKPDWDPVLFSNSCYIAHLCGVDRLRALELGAYSDPTTEASPDWDLFMRFANAGVEPLHVSEVLYSWRIHSSSTAGDSRVKPYALETHRMVLERFIGARSDSDHFAVQIHPDSPDRLDWWIRRRQVDPRPLVTVIIGTDRPGSLEPVPLVDHQIHAVHAEDVEQFRAIVDGAVAVDGLVHVLNSSATILRSDWYWEALGLMELYSETVAVGGPIIRDDRILSAGDVFGFGPTGWGGPAHGEPSHSRGWFAQNLKQRAVDGLGGDHMVCDARWIQAGLVGVDLGETDLTTLGARLTLDAARSGRVVLYSPLLRANVALPFQEQWSQADRVEIGRAAAQEASGRNRSHHLSLESNDPFGTTTRTKRTAHLNELSESTPRPAITFHDWLVQDIEGRSARYPAPAMPPSVSVITPVYAGTETALLAELATCLKSQSCPPQEWIIGIDGELPQDLAEFISSLVDGSNFVRTTGGAKVGILGTMRCCLTDCVGEYVVPVDADDLLTPDALAILLSVAVSEDLPDLVHSDEDILDGDRFRDPFLRPDWDPVLHLAGSYVWHALCIKRATALDIGLYGEPRFEWCHDWDTVERIRRIDGKIVHVPEVLYHWRRHSGSSTNTDNPESAQEYSVRAVFERIGVDTGHPERYEVTEFPLWRGATEFHLQRRPVDPPAVSLLTLGAMTAPTFQSIAHASTFPIEASLVGPTSDSTLDILVAALERIDSTLVWILDPELILTNDEPVWEAIKWFGLLDDVGAVCGRFVSTDGTVTTGAELVDHSQPAGVVRPLTGRALTDPGPYALALKPHSIDLVDTRNAVFDRTLLVSILRTLPDDLTIGTSGLHLGRSMTELGRRVVYTPLMTALEPDTQVASPAPIGDVGASRRGLKPFYDGRRLFF